MSIKTHHHERTLVIIKPDGIQRGLVGDIITRFEKKGLKIVAVKMVQPTKEKAFDHYEMAEADKLALGQKTIDAYREKGVDLGRTPLEQFKRVQEMLVEYLTAGPVIAIVIEGAHAIAHVRKIRGKTNPLDADVGSITADLTIDSYFAADEAERAVRNLVHASGSVDEAEREIAIWFDKNEVHDYDLAIEKILYSKDWEKTREEVTKASHPH